MYSCSSSLQKIGLKALLGFNTLILIAAFMIVAASQARSESLANFLPKLEPAQLYVGADSFGAVRDVVPVAPILKDGKTVAWAFLTSDFVGTTGY